MSVQQKRFHFTTVIGEDRKIVIELPPDTPTGEAQIQVSVQSTPDKEETIYNPDRERIRAKLLAAGALSTAHHTTEGNKRPTAEKVRRAGTPPPGARSSEEILREIRDEED